MTKRTLLLGLGGAFLLALAAFGVLRSAFPALIPWTLNPRDVRVSLADVEREVERRYRVLDMTPDMLTEKLAAGGVVLLDVRTQAEFDQGHLPGAIRVEPDEPPEGLVRAQGERLKGKTVVFYCAVGVRSSELMVRASAILAPNAPAGLYNLRVGIFRWVAEGRTLVAEGKPGSPHPYDANWGKLLTRSLSPP
jgi:rhodanese-related sulfurtransferase